MFLSEKIGLQYELDSKFAGAFFLTLQQCRTDYIYMFYNPQVLASFWNTCIPDVTIATGAFCQSPYDFFKNESSCSFNLRSNLYKLNRCLLRALTFEV